MFTHMELSLAPQLLVMNPGKHQIKKRPQEHILNILIFNICLRFSVLLFS